MQKFVTKTMERQRSIPSTHISMSSSNFFKQIPRGRKNYTAQKNVLFAQKIEIIIPSDLTYQYRLAIVNLIIKVNILEFRFTTLHLFY